MRKTLFLFLTLISSIAFCDQSNEPAAYKYAKKYLEIVYPTSKTIKQMSPKNAYTYYSDLNYWYRVPTKEYPNGIYNNSLEPQLNVFLFPDTSMRINTSNDSYIDNHGFTSDKVIQGSNKNYIEVSSMGWMMFPYGGYFNWSKGSGIYLYTGGKTIAGYNKIDVIYKIYKSENKLKEFYTKLGNNNTVRTQIIGKSIPFSMEMYNLLISKSFNPKDWKYIPKVGNNSYDPLILCLVYSKNWNEIKSKLASFKSAKEAYQYLVHIYVEDHINAKYNESSKRYSYLAGEENASIDKWMYNVVKSAGINVIQMTLEPNSAGSPTFEICDVRWPEVEFKGMSPAVLGDKAIEGLQSYDLMYIWDKMILKGLITVRDPFNLENNSKAKAIQIKYPKYSKINPAMISNPPKNFPSKWLPKYGWGLEQAKKYGYIKADSFIDWIKTHECPPPLNIKETKNMCHLISFGLNNVENHGFSPTNIEYNTSIL
ncbi:hypothetical protein [Francisella sp. 19X1-34]|uniref:hypothetical protein n=1 Tax=Francisella sp. 19X1-34 TaxID=3087177 RepID=UPI002E2F0FA9|nr:hypothetical protein [Francisella sp. 19X1-34]MED7789106.1 hypothetical protein [Francisella sp. 19X1-34]